MIHITVIITIVGHIIVIIIHITIIITIDGHITGTIIQITVTTTGHIAVTIDIMKIITATLITAIVTIMITVVGRVFPAWAQRKHSAAHAVCLPFGSALARKCVAPQCRLRLAIGQG
jgi:hypothetical protein